MSACVVAKRCSTLNSTISQPRRNRQLERGSLRAPCSAHIDVALPCQHLLTHGVGKCETEACMIAAGTGKTKTILGLLSVIMHSRPASRSASSGGGVASQQQRR